jgi:GAF domain-containing protein
MWGARITFLPLNDVAAHQGSCAAVADIDALLRLMASFSRELAGARTINDALQSLAIRASIAARATGAGASLANGGSVRFAAAIDRAATAIERAQEDSQQGPCVDALSGRKPVRVNDLRELPQLWPVFRKRALEYGVVAVLSVPVQLAGTGLAALDLYDAYPRDWLDEEIAWLRILCDLAAGHIVRAMNLEHTRRVAEQLRDALDKQIIIEQAKGVIAGDQHVSVDEAFVLIQRHAIGQGASLQQVAEAIVSLGLRP